MREEGCRLGAPHRQESRRKEKLNIRYILYSTFYILNESSQAESQLLIEPMVGLADPSTLTIGHGRGPALGIGQTGHA